MPAGPAPIIITFGGSFVEVCKSLFLAYLYHIKEKELDDDKGGEGESKKKRKKGD